MTQNLVPERFSGRETDQADQLRKELLISMRSRRWISFPLSTSRYPAENPWGSINFFPLLSDIQQKIREARQEVEEAEKVEEEELMNQEQTILQRRQARKKVNIY